MDMVAEAATGLRLTAKRLKLLRASRGIINDGAEPVVREYRGTVVEPDPLHGLFETTVDGRRRVVEYEHDPLLRGTEQVPLLEEGGVDGFLRREVLPYDPDIWYDPATVKVGYEINFNRHFYKPESMRSLEEIRADLAALEQETVNFLDLTGFSPDPAEEARWRVYVDNSVFGASQSDEEDGFRESSQQFFRDILANKFTLVLSDVTQRELDQAPEAVQAVLGRLPFPQTEYAEASGEAEALAERYILDGALTLKSWADALHIATATVAGVDLLVSWNFKHMVNARRIRAFNRVNVRAGYSQIDIRTPREAIEYE